MAEILCDDPYTGDAGEVFDDVVELLDSRFNSGFWSDICNWLSNQNIRSFKIGKTYDPWRRATGNDYGGGYGYMDIVYCSSDYDEASWMEEALIEEFIDESGCDNQRIRGASGCTPPDNQDYYVYVVYNVGPESKHEDQEYPVHYEDDDDYDDDYCQECGENLAAKDCPFQECGSCCRDSEETCARHSK